ncbi:DNA recombination protein RmuC [hydrothermal vent metagenome]|uniref:DNA recombination protein RmuC n=1 Tax=hydrothermal vent metagenome TaxID=652676 RepID=A0A3B0WDC9_9ZZZZ
MFDINFNEILLMALLVLVFANIIIALFKKTNTEITFSLKALSSAVSTFGNTLEKTEATVKDEFQRNRKELNETSKSNRDELSQSLHSFEKKLTDTNKNLSELLKQTFNEFSKQQSDVNKQTTDDIKEVKSSIEKQLKEIREDNAKQLDEMRKTVDEKLQKTLNERLSQSFKTVGTQLQSVQEGLGEMKALATDVGGLKKALSNVKLRGGIGEVQLEMLLEQILAPEQYEANVKTKKDSSDLVEFAIKFPGGDDSGSIVWLPIDAKFPKDVYEQLIETYETGEAEAVKAARSKMELTIKKMAKDISEKYIDPPNTTDFAIMFLPFEGIYAEVTRNATLLEMLRRDYNIIVAGPTNLAVILNGFYMGFKTLAIEKRSSEVWQVLGSVKKEFDNFGGMMDKAQKNIQTGLNQLDDVMGIRTRAIQRKLKNVETLADENIVEKNTKLDDSTVLAEDED